MFEVGKDYITRGGRSVRILALDLWGPYPIAGIIKYGDNDWQVWGFTREGFCTGDTRNRTLDLIVTERPEPSVADRLKFLEERVENMSRNMSVLSDRQSGLLS